MIVRYTNTLLVLPTRNPGELFDVWVDALNKLNNKPGLVAVIDSSSTDGTSDKAKAENFALTVIAQADFNHGATRQWAVENNLEYEFVVFMTQDAILSTPDAFRNILTAFDDSSVAAVCGRQLPRHKAGAIEAHSRLYNYSDQSSLRSFQDRETIGIKAAFLSNSFAAYRVSALKRIGGFPADVIFGEDMYVAARMLKAGSKIAYAADACVYHSHDYSLLQEFKRYFDMGVFHAREPWIRQEFGGAEGEGLRFVVSELKYLLKHAFWLIPEGILRTLFRYAGFRLGLIEKKLPPWMKQRLAMNKGYFKE